ncbi:hypothetical protein [Variovorax sp. J22R115]|uniref:hypothetical protein n=1 Tax=Variovorax sp. J22R115 TaxID=3053509 RepID=UPI0025779DA9|nr:hypothetical protein [Variovorax sp. J22R115]MDM0049938.1 hypothetical protein [Variovorax sp. J22R115]
MNRTPEQRQAQLTWVLACERLGFVMDPPEGATPEGGLADLAAAIAQVRLALEELESVFAPGKKG